MGKADIGGRTPRPRSAQRYDSEFHQALLSACGSRVLLDCHAAVFDRYVRYLMIAVIFRSAAFQNTRSFWNAPSTATQRQRNDFWRPTSWIVFLTRLQMPRKNLLGPNPAHLTARRKSGDRVLVA
jgi:hypothetical protein